MKQSPVVDTTSNVVNEGQREPEEFLNQRDLAERWNYSVRTLERWRWEGKGPKYIKVGSRVRYRRSDIVAFEVAHEHLGEGRKSRR